MATMVENINGRSKKKNNNFAQNEFTAETSKRFSYFYRQKDENHKRNNS